VFPLRLLNLLRRDGVRDFYSLLATPERVSLGYGEPMLATVTVRNSGDDVLTIGPDGLLSDQIRLDANVRGLIQERVPAAATATLAGRTRLEPGERLEQVVRIDGPELSAVLARNPLIQLTVFGEVVTNPASGLVTNPDDPEGEPVMAYGLSVGGQSTSLERVFSRRALPLDLNNPEVRGEINRRLGQLRDGEPAEQIAAADATLAQLRWISARIEQLQQDGNQQELQGWQQLGATMIDELRRAAIVGDVRSEGSRSIANAWLRFRAASLVADESRAGILAPLAESEEPVAQAIGLLGMGSLVTDAEVAQRYATTMLEQEDPTVRRLAAATLRQLERRETVAAE
jgi:hypothetical protein